MALKPGIYRVTASAEGYLSICTVFLDIHQVTQRVLRNTVTVANIPHMHITIKNLGIASVFLGGLMEE